MRVVVLQPSYVPWRGYFHQIRKADLFVFYDDVQYDKHGWRNRNRLKTAAGTRWLTIPALSGGVVSRGVAIKDVRIDWTKKWNLSHWDIIRQHYRTAPYFERYALLVESFYQRHDEFLADLTIDTTLAVARELGITDTQFVRSTTLRADGVKTDRLISILRQVRATHYISGPSAKGYLEEDKLAEAGISLEYMSYDYPEYPQLYPPFDPAVSILDLLFMVGPEAPRYIWAK